MFELRTSNPESSVLTVKAYAKVNLILQIQEKRPDGFHSVNTILQNIDLADSLTFQEASTLKLESSVDIKQEENLVFKAAQLLKSHTATNKGAKITLKKLIPIQAGLGGGSADAAATLISLNKLWSSNIEKSELHKLGARLGSDVNFFLEGGLAKATGRGEEILPISTNLSLRMVIAKPDFGIKAKEAYSEWDKNPTNNKVDIEALISKLKSQQISENEFFNDLQPRILAKYPQLNKIFEAGYVAGASKVMLSGSGSAIFAIVSGKAQNKVYEAWQNIGCKVYKARAINRSVEVNES